MFILRELGETRSTSREKKRKNELITTVTEYVSIGVYACQ